MQDIEYLVDEVLASPTILGAFQAGRRLNKALQRTTESTEAGQLIIESCGESADVLAQYLLIHALSHAPSPRVHDAFTGSDKPPDAMIQRDSISGPSEREGLRIAQVVLQGRLDSGLRGVGNGDSGGLTTLLVSLGKALGEQPEIDHVYTIARAIEGPGVPEIYRQPQERFGGFLRCRPWRSSPYQTLVDRARGYRSRPAESR